MGIMDQPTAYFGGGYVIKGDIEFSGSLLQDPISIGAGSIANEDTMAIGVGSEATGSDAVSVGKDSKAVNRLTAAFGYDAQATGMDATALGSETRAPSNWNTVVGYGAGTLENGENVVIVGRNSEAQGNDAVAIGEVSRANGNQSTAVGRDTDALGDNASVFGQGSTANGLGTTVVGQGVEVASDEATSVGTNVDVSGLRATGVGRNITASASDTTVVGEGATASADSSTAVGRNTEVTGENSLAIGAGTTVTQDNTFTFGDRNVNLPLGRSFLYPPDAGEQTVIDFDVTSSPAQGTDQSYAFSISGQPIFEVAAEADGSGGIQNKVARIRGSFDIRGGEDDLSDIISGDISIVDSDGNEQVGLDATSDPVNIDLHNNRVNNFGIRSGESITYPTDTGSETFVDFSISDPSNNSEQSYAFSVGGNSVARVFSEGDGAGGLKNVQLRLDENLNANGKDLVDNGTTIWNGTHKYIEQTALENDTVTYESGDGLVGAGGVPLGGSSTINIGAGTFITANASDIEVNIGSGLEGDGTDNIRIRGDQIADGFLSEGANPYQLSVNVDRGLKGDGSNNIQVDEDVAFDFTSQISFGSGLDVSGDIEDGTAVIWNSTNGYIEQTALENDSVTLNTSNGISAGSVSLGSSVNIGISGALTLDTDLETSGSSLIWDSTNSHIPQGRLENDTVEYTAGNGIASAGSVSLGSSTGISVDPFSYVTVDANGVSVNIGTGLEGDGSDNIQVDETTQFDFSNQIQFSGGLDTRGDITDGTVTIWNDSQQYINQGALQNDSVGVSSGNGLTGGTSSLALGDSVTIDIAKDGIQTTEIDESIAPTWTGSHIFNGGLAMGDSIDMQSDQGIINLPSPDQVGDAARKGYVDSVAQGLNLKKSCQVATDGISIDLSSSTDPNPVDGYTISDGDRVLLKDQSDATENGIYEAVTATDPTTWTRSSDFNDDDEVTSGSFTFVSNGTVNGSTSFTVVTQDSITLGTDSIEFDQFASAGEIIGGVGLTKDGQTLDVDVSGLSGTGIEESSSTFRIASEAAGDGLTGGSGSAFDIVVSDFAGSGIVDDGTGDLELNTPFADLASLFSSPVSVGDKLGLEDDDLSFGSNDDFLFNYDSQADELVFRDGDGIELFRQPKSGSINFLQGVDVGSISASEDSFTQLINLPVTSSLADGEKVGYSFSLDNQTAISIDGKSDGNGGVTDQSINVHFDFIRDGSGSDRLELNSNETILYDEDGDPIIRGRSGNGHRIDVYGGSSFSIFDRESGANGVQYDTDTSAGVLRTPNAFARIEDEQPTVSSGEGLEIHYDQADARAKLKARDAGADSLTKFNIYASIVDISQGTPNLRLATGQFIEDGSGTNRLAVGNGSTTIYDEGGRVAFTTRNTDNTQIRAYSNQPYTIQDQEGSFTAVQYTTGSTAGVLRTPNAGARIEADAEPSSGAGMELKYDTSKSPSRGLVFSYDRGGSAYTDIRIGGATVDLQAMGGLIDASVSPADLRLATGQSIEDGAGTDRVELSSTRTNLNDETGTSLIHVEDGTVDVSGDIIPSTSNAINLGSDSNYFSTVHSETFQTHSPAPRKLSEALSSIGSYVESYGSMEMEEMVANLVTVVEKQQDEIKKLKDEVASQ